MMEKKMLSVVKKRGILSFIISLNLLILAIPTTYLTVWADENDKNPGPESVTYDLHEETGDQKQNPQTCENRLSGNEITDDAAGSNENYTAADEDNRPEIPCEGVSSNNADSTDPGEEDTKEVAVAIDQGTDTYEEEKVASGTADWEFYCSDPYVEDFRNTYTYNESTGELYIEVKYEHNEIIVEAASDKPLLSLNGICVSHNGGTNKYWDNNPQTPEVRIFTRGSRIEIVDPTVSFSWNNEKKTARYNSKDHGIYEKTVQHCALKRNDGTMIWLKGWDEFIQLSANDVLFPEKKLESGKAGTSNTADILYESDTCEIFLSNGKTGKLIAYEKPNSSVVSISQNNVIGNTAVSTLDISDIIDSNYIIVEFDDETYGYCTDLPLYEYQNDNALGRDFDFNNLARILDDYTSEEFTIACDYLTNANKSKIEFLITRDGKRSRKEFERRLNESLINGSHTGFKDNKFTWDGQSGETVYVYYRYKGGDYTFTKYADKPLSVTLGVTKRANIRPVVSRSLFAGDILGLDDIEFAVDPNGLSENDIDYIQRNINKEELKLCLSDSVDNGYVSIPVTINESMVGDNLYIKPLQGYSETSLRRDHDLYRIFTGESEYFKVKTTDNKLVADSELKFYYGQDKSGLIANARIKGLTVDKADVGKQDVIAVKVGASDAGGEIGEELNDNQLRKVNKDSKIFAQFTLNGKLTSNIIELNVDAHPVRAFAKINYFSRQYDQKAETAVITDAGLFETVDLYGTPFARTISFTDYFSTTAVKPVFTEVETGNCKFGKQDYGLNLSVKPEYESIKDNYDFTGGNHENFGYYVAPVYNVTIRGKIKSATVNGLERTVDVPFTVDSDMAANLESYKTEYSKKIFDRDPDLESKVTLPVTVKLLNDANRFTGWSRDEKSVKGTDTITADTEYIAEVAESVYGFTSSENTVFVMLEDASIYYTGLKHVTNPVEMEKRYFENPGLIDSEGIAAIEKARKNANSNSGDVRLFVYMGDRLLVENYDYTAVYKNNINACELKDTSVIPEKDWAKKAPQVCITFKRNYASLPTITKYFSIHRMDISWIGETCGVDGCGVDSRINKTVGKELAPDKVFKTDLVNKYTGKTLNSKKDVEFSIISGDPSMMKEGTKGVKISGKGNYTGSKTVSVNFISPGIKFKWVTVNVPLRQCNIGGDEQQKVNIVDFDTDDTLKKWEEEIKDDICNNIMQKDKTVKVKSKDIILYRIKTDYSMPGTKKVNYKAYVLSKDVEKAFKGSYQYNVSGVDPGCMKVSWSIDKSNEVPYAKGGVAIPYMITYMINNDPYPYDFSRIIKAVYKNNKKTGKNARITLKPIKSGYVTGSMNSEDFYRDFDIRTAGINEDIYVRNAYIVRSDIAEGNAAKTIANIKKTGSIMLVDAKNSILKCGSDYTIENVTPQSGKYTVEVKAMGKNYTGTKTIMNVSVLEGYLGSYTIKMTGNAKKIAASDIDALTAGTLSNKEFADKYGLELWGKYGDSKKDQKIEQTGGNFNFVVTVNKPGGNAYIQAAGIDGGPLGGSEVLAKKQLKKAVE